MKKLTLRLLLFLTIFYGLILYLVSCVQTKDFYSPVDNWRVSIPEEQGVNSKILLKMLKNIQSSTLDFHSILVIRNGYIITEAYWAPYNKNTTHNIKSASKSIISALAGIALENNYLDNLDQKVSEFYPEYVNEPLKQDISLEDLLTMTGGFDWMEDSGPSPYDLDNWNKIPMRDKPGEKFEYNTMMTHMMSAILTKTSGECTKEFADKWLFKPLGIKDYQWRKSEDGIYHGGSDIFLTPRDMAKFGYLFLHNGQWGRQEIVPKEWVKESITPKITIPSEAIFGTGLEYGYWWWIKEDTYFAWGAGGQYIFIRPDLDLVVVITANGFNDINRYNGFMKAFLDENIYQAIKSDNALPANPQAFQDLNQIVKEIENPKEKPIQTIPEITTTVSNNKYIFEPNAVGFQSTTLSFKNNAVCLWTYYIGEKEVNLLIGLNGNFLINTIEFSMGVNPDSEKIACKGYWDSNAFIIEHHIIGDPSKQIFTFSFDGDKINMNLTTIGMDVAIKGTKEK